ncbi:MAG: transcriptional regulator domain-containing protein [Sphingobium sp.]
MAELTEPAHFAWEILRRRHDYVASPATTTVLRRGPKPIVRIDSVRSQNDWGLSFRRRSRPVGGIGPALLAIRC